MIYNLQPIREKKRFFNEVSCLSSMLQESLQAQAAGGSILATTYTAKDITVLEGLEPVRKRPAMYIGSTDVRGLHHLVWEMLDNAVDEALNGYCTAITLRIEKDGGVTVIGQRPRHARRYPSQDQTAGHRDDPLHAPCGRQVRPHGLQILGRPPRRGRFGRERAFRGLHRHGLARRLSSGPRSSPAASPRATSRRASPPRRTARRSISGPIRRSSPRPTSTTRTSSMSPRARPS